MLADARDLQEATSRRVVAAIVHDTRRVLAVQRNGEALWRPPAGQVVNGESTIAAARRHARRTTGFEIAPWGRVDRYPTDDGALSVVRCRVSGVGADIAPEICALRWLRRSDVLSQPHAPWTRGLLRALDFEWDVATKPQADQLIAV